MNRLREIRENCNLKQAEIAKILFISQVAYSYYELERRQIPIDILIKLATYYNTSVDYLLYLTDEKKPYPKSIMKK